MDRLSADRVGLDSSAIRTGAGLIDRPRRSVVSVLGADRAAFLQGLLTNDVIAMGPGHGCYAAYLTPQGRMITDMTVLVRSTAIQLVLPPALYAALAPRLDAQVFSEDVQLVDLAGVWSTLAVAGPSSAVLVSQAVAALGGAIEPARPLAEWSEHDHAGLTIDGAGSGTSPTVIAAAHDFDDSGFELHGPAGDVASLRSAMQALGAREMTPGAAELARIERGRPAFGIDMDGETIPLEAGIEDRAISLTKGCYVGQEVIIRVLHRGQGRVARRLVGLIVDPDGAAAGADTIVSGDRSIGRVTSAAWSPSRGRVVALGYVHRDFVSPGTAVTVLHDGVPQGATVR